MSKRGWLFRLGLSSVLFGCARFEGRWLPLQFANVRQIARAKIGASSRWSVTEAILDVPNHNERFATIFVKNVSVFITSDEHDLTCPLRQRSFNRARVETLNWYFFILMGRDEIPSYPSYWTLPSVVPKQFFSRAQLESVAFHSRTHGFKAQMDELFGMKVGAVNSRVKNNPLRWCIASVLEPNCEPVLWIALFRYPFRYERFFQATYLDIGPTIDAHGFGCRCGLYSCCVGVAFAVDVRHNHLTVHQTIRDGVPSNNEKRNHFDNEPKPFPAFATASFGLALALWGMLVVGSAVRGLAHWSFRYLLCATMASVCGHALWLYGVYLILKWWAWWIVA